MSRTLFRTRIKFCGMTRAGDVRLASELGADAVGFIFAEGSPRHIHAREARLLRNALAPLVDAVAVVRDNAAWEVREGGRKSTRLNSSTQFASRMPFSRCKLQKKNK